MVIPVSPPGHVSVVMMRVVGAVALAAAIAIAGARPAGAQSSSDSTGAVVVSVVHDTRPLELAVVRAGPARAQTDAGGRATLRLPAGSHTVVATRIGYRPDSAVVLVRAGTDTAITIALASHAAEIEAVVVTATRGERRVEDTPLRVEVIDEEEIAEKVAMTPGDIAMMLNETIGPSRADDQPVARRRQRAHPGARRPLLAAPRRRAPALRRPGGRARAAPDPAAGPRPRGGHQGDRVGAVRQHRRSAAWSNLALAPAERRGGAHGAREPDLARRHGRRGVPLRAALGARGDTRCSRAGTVNRAATSTATGGRTCRATSASSCGRASTSTTAAAHRLSHRRLHRRGPATAARSPGASHRTAAVRRGARHAARRRGRARALGGAGLGERRSAARSLTLRGSAVEQRHAHDFGTVREDDRHRTWFGEAALAVPRGRVTLRRRRGVPAGALPRRGRAGVRLHVHRAGRCSRRPTWTPRRWLVALGERARSTRTASTARS